MTPTLSIIINAGNEQNVIAPCLHSASFADEIIFIAANSTDNTIKIAREICPSIKLTKVFDSYGQNYAKWHNLGLAQATSDWVFHLDADERITPKLRQELLTTIKKPLFDFYVVPRANYFLGRRVRHGGTYPDYVKRLFQRSKIRKWAGKIHEEPLIDGSPGFLKNDLLHFTHRHLTSMLQKTILWTDIEAKALFQNNHPPVVWWRFFRMMSTKFWQRFVAQSMWRDGLVGWISAVFEVFDTFIIYARLWELQQQDR